MNIHKVVFSLLAIFFTSVSIKADSLIDFEGCFYRIIGDDEVELVTCFSDKLEGFVNSVDKKGILPSEVINGDKVYRLTSIADSVFCNTPDLILVVPSSIRHIGGGNDVKRILLKTRGQNVISYGSMVVNRRENRILWVNSACKDVKVVQLPPKMFRIPEDFVTHFPKMETLISPDIETLSENYTIIAKSDTIYAIGADSWQWHSPYCKAVEHLVASSYWEEAHIRNIKSHFPNLRSVGVVTEIQSKSPSPFVSICGALCHKEEKSIILIPPRMVAETDTLSISQQLVEYLPADFFIQFPQLKHIDIETEKGNRDIEVKEDKLYYKSNLVAEVPCTIKKNTYKILVGQPEFPGGLTELMKYLQKNIKYPTVCKEQGIQGRVIVQFVVNLDGSIVEPQVVKPVNPYLDKEALRVVNAMPKWKPGIQRDEPIRTSFTLPITFRLGY